MLRSVPGWRRVVTVLCLAGVLTPAAVGAAADPQTRLREVEQEIDGARSDLRKVERRKAVELADLQQLDARRAELDAELARLNADLEVAQAELAASQAQLESTTQELVATEAKLADTRRRLELNRTALNDRARATYMYGGRGGWAHIVVGVDNLEQFQRGLKYARSVLQENQRRVERISALEVNVERATADLAELQERHAAQRAEDAQRRDAAAEIVTEREAVAAQVDAQAEQRRLLVARLESDRRSYVAMVSELEAEGSRLEQELRRRAEEAARREAARQAAAEAEARRVAAEQAARDRERARAERSRTGGGSGGGGGGGEAPASSPTAMQWPANGPKTSDYGWRTHPIFGTRRFHAGIDIGAGYGAPIVAALGGTVIEAGSRGGYGNTIIVDHGGGLTTLYAHQSSFAVATGQQVSRGDTIGYVGSTGYSTGPHLHFEVRVNGATRNPMDYF